MVRPLPTSMPSFPFSLGPHSNSVSRTHRIRTSAHMSLALPACSGATRIEAVSFYRGALLSEAISCGPEIAPSAPVNVVQYTRCSVEAFSPGVRVSMKTSLTVLVQIAFFIVLILPGRANADCSPFTSGDSLFGIAARYGRESGPKSDAEMYLAGIEARPSPAMIKNPLTLD